MHAKYWKIADGQLNAGEVFDSGSCEKDAADKKAQSLDRHYQAVVRKLKTIESDAPNDGPGYEPFPSHRWCVIVRGQGFQSPSGRPS